jgi:ABC-2 type transport system ATP-binding protein
MLIMSQGDTLAMGTPTQIRMLARTPETPQPTMDDAFIALAEGGLGVPRQDAPVDGGRAGEGR